MLGGASIAFHVGLIFSGLVPNLVARPLHMALALPWVFLFTANTRRARWTGGAILALGWAACAYIAFNAGALSDQYGFLQGPLQLGVAVTLLVVVLEMARRSISWPLPTLAALALLYGLFGEHIPGEFGHAGLPLSSFLGTLTIAEGGIWGKLTGISVSVVAIFVILGAVLNAGEAGQGFMNLAHAAAGRLTGGAAKVAVLSSAFFGSISGSASANVASTGAVTLPAMRRLGYPPAFAGAVEAVASSGGQIMPPLMGAGAFVMVELTGTPYGDIMLAAILPAVLYFATVWMGISAFASRFDLRPVDRDSLPSRRDLVVTSAFFAVPFVVLLERMFIGGYTPQYAASAAILAGVALTLIGSDLRISLPRALARMETACVESGRQIALIASIILCASIIIGVLGMTGLGVKVTSFILAGAQGSLWMALGLTALACLLLGMEVPTTAAYIICVSVAGPALAEMGLPLLSAHLFVFWYALLSTITPPVCGAVFIAAGIVGANWLSVALYAMALGLGLYIIPLAMVANPGLIALGLAPWGAALAFVKVGGGLWLLTSGVIRRTAPVLRLVFVLGGLLLIFLP